jgi:UDP-N-acetylmuramoylalanine--D-glutamate ligase
VGYINDSKSIRLTATRNSLELLTTPVVLILGGEDIDNDYSILAKQIKQKVTSIIYLGSDNDQIFKHYAKSYLLFAKASTINEAVKIAAAYAKSGDSVLFSPACDSKNYKNRGNEFKEVVKHLTS